MQRCRMKFRFPAMSPRAAVRCELQLDHAGPHEVQGILEGGEQVGPGAWGGARIRVVYRVNWTRGERVNLLPTVPPEATTGSISADDSAANQKDVREGPSADLLLPDLWAKPLTPEETNAADFGKEGPPPLLWPEPLTPEGINAGFGVVIRTAEEPPQ